MDFKQQALVAADEFEAAQQRKKEQEKHEQREREAQAIAAFRAALDVGNLPALIKELDGEWRYGKPWNGNHEQAYLHIDLPANTRLDIRHYAAGQVYCAFNSLGIPYSGTSNGVMAIENLYDWLLVIYGRCLQAEEEVQRSEAERKEAYSQEQQRIREEYQAALAADAENRRHIEAERQAWMAEQWYWPDGIAVTLYHWEWCIAPAGEDGGAEYARRFSITDTPDADGYVLFVSDRYNYEASIRLAPESLPMVERLTVSSVADLPDVLKQDIREPREFEGMCLSSMTNPDGPRTDLLIGHDWQSHCECFKHEQPVAWLREVAEPFLELAA